LKYKKLTLNISMHKGYFGNSNIHLWKIYYFKYFS